MCKTFDFKQFKPNPTQLYLILTLHITPFVCLKLGLLFSWMENTVIQHIFIKLTRVKKQIFN